MYSASPERPVASVYRASSARQETPPAPPKALAAAETFRATTALLDIGLPVMDGYELARRLREVWNDHPVRFVAITGYGQEADKERAKSCGFDTHMVKPIDLDELAAVLQE